MKIILITSPNFKKMMMVYNQLSPIEPLLNISANGLNGKSYYSNNRITSKIPPFYTLETQNFLKTLKALLITQPQQ